MKASEMNRLFELLKEEMEGLFNNNKPAFWRRLLMLRTNNGYIRVGRNEYAVTAVLRDADSGYAFSGMTKDGKTVTGYILTVEPGKV